MAKSEALFVLAFAAALSSCTQPGPHAQSETKSGDFTVVTWDNPDFTEVGVTLTPAKTKWNGVMDRTIDAGISGVANGNGDFRVWTSGGDGPAASNGISVFPSVRDEELVARPDAFGQYSSSSGNAVVDFRAHGLRVGYTPLLVRLFQFEPDRTKPAPFTTLHARLDPNVKLVPIEAVVMYHAKDAQGHFDGNTEQQRRVPQLMFWDHWPERDTANFTDGQFGEIKSVQHAMSWVRRDPLGRYAVSTQMAPDAVWNRCGVQFRLVNYFELQAPTRNVNPARGNDERDPDRFWPDGTTDSAPLQENLQNAKKDPRHMDGTTTVIFMGRVGFTDAPEVGRALTGQGAIGVSLADGRSTDGVVGHELGHLSGMGDAKDAGKDANGKPLWDVMLGLGPGVDPTENECRAMKKWADQRISFWTKPHTNPEHRQ